jgi:hypothetical protein
MLQEQSRPLALAVSSEPLQRVKGSLDFGDRRFRPARSGEDAGQIEAGSGSLERCPGFIEEVDGILEPASRFFVVSAGARDDALDISGHCSEGSGGNVRRNRLQFGHASCGLGVVATGGLSTRKQFQPIDSLHPFLRRQAPQETLRQLDCRR